MTLTWRDNVADMPGIGKWKIERGNHDWVLRTYVDERFLGCSYFNSILSARSAAERHFQQLTGQIPDEGTRAA